MKYAAILLSLICITLLMACEQKPRQAKELQYSKAPVHKHLQTYRFVIHPLYNPQQLTKAYQPLIDYLNRQIPDIRIELEASRDYQVYEKKFRQREPEFLLPNPWQTLQAIKVGYHVIAMAGDAEDFKGSFLVRRDSGIRTVADLKGKTVSYPSHTALAAAIMPQYYLHTHGIDVNRDILNSYVGSQLSSILSVYLGNSAAAATWPQPWRLFQKESPAEAAQLELIWETPSLLNNSVMVRDDIPAAIRDQLALALTGLDKTTQGRNILAGMETARFHPATDNTYDPIKTYIDRFEREVRAVEQR